MRTLAVLLFAACLASAADKPAKPAKPPARPLGTWTRDAGGADLTMSFKADTFVFKVAVGDKALTAQGSYATTKDGLLFGVITKVEPETADIGPSKGDLFSFRFAVKKGEMTLSDLNGTKASDEAKKHVEGAYSAKK